MEIKLWENDVPYFDKEFQYDINSNAPTLTPYLIGSGKTGCVIICPGGGYQNRAWHEGEPIAKWINSLGLNAFVLNYRVAPYSHPVPITDGKRAIRHIRYNCEKYNVFPDKIAVLGFSAGGHLACMLAEGFEDISETSDDIDRVDAMPNAAVLCYPVITMRECTHAGSRSYLTNNNFTPELISQLSCEENVTAVTCPMFVWHTWEDMSVVPEHTIELVRALRNKNIPVEYHLFNKGRHGLGLAENVTGTQEWTKICGIWLLEVLGIVK